MRLSSLGVKRYKSLDFYREASKTMIFGRKKQKKLELERIRKLEWLSIPIIEQIADMYLVTLRESFSKNENFWG